MDERTAYGVFGGEGMDMEISQNFSTRSSDDIEENFNPSLLSLYKSFDTDEALHYHTCFCFPISWNPFVLGVFTFMDNPSSSKYAVAYSWLMQFVVIVSLTELVLESFESLHAQPSWKDALFIIDFVTTIIFTLDYVIRIVLCPGGWSEKFRFATNIFNIIDLFSIIPFYLVLIMNWAFTGSLTILRILRIFKLFRLLKLGRYSRTGYFLFQAVKHAKEGILFLIVLIVIISALCGSLVYFAEIADCYLSTDLIWIYKSGPLEGLPTFFQNIPLGMYWTIVVVATVGYGEAVPYTWYGRGVAVLTIVIAIILVAFPFTIIGNAFSRKTMEFDQKVAKIRREEHLAKLKRWRKKRLQKITAYEKAREETNAHTDIAHHSSRKETSTLEQLNKSTSVKME